MQISRRRFLSTIGHAAAAHTMPAPMLRLAETFSPAAQTGIAAIGSGTIEAIVGRMNDSWNAFYEGFSVWNYAAGVNKPGVTLHDTITGHLNVHLPAIFSAVKDFREMKSKILTGDDKIDGERLLVLRTATEIKKRFYIDDLTHLAALCPDSEPDGDFSGWVDRRMSMEERQKRHGAFLPFIQMQDLVRRVTDIRQNLNGLEDCPLFEAKVSLDELMQCAFEQGLITDSFKSASQARRDAAYAAIKVLCQPSGMCSETVDALAGVVPTILTDCNSSTLEVSELYELFDDRALFESIAGIVSDQVDAVVGGLGIYLSDNNGSETAGFRAQAIDYIENQFTPILHTLYRQHFSAAMPDVLDIPLPAIDQSIAEFSVNIASEIEEGADAVASEEAVSPTLETASTEAEIDFMNAPYLRLASITGVNPRAILDDASQDAATVPAGIIESPVNVFCDANPRVLVAASTQESDCHPAT